jgi:hypothetical protein
VRGCFRGHVSVFRLRKERKERGVRGNSGVSLTLRFFDAGLDVGDS